MNKKNKRLSLGLKPSYFEGDPDSSSDEGEGDDHGGNGDLEPDSAKRGTTATDTSFAKTEATGPSDEGRGDQESMGDGDCGQGQRDEGTRKRSRGVFMDALDMGEGGAANAFGLDFGLFGSRVDRMDETESEDEEDSDESDEDTTG